MNVHSEHLFNLPDELKALPQWVCWRKQPKPDGGFTKIPLDAKTGTFASTSDPSTWASYAVAAAAFAHGVGDGNGFVLTEHDPYCGVDMDHCRDPQTGQLEQWAYEIFVQCNSYTEVTPSGEGIRIWMKGTLPGTGGNNSEGFEIYDRGRFFTVTGDHVGGSPATIEARQSLITALYRAYFPEKEKTYTNGNGKAHASFSDEERAVILADLKIALPFIPAVAHDVWLRVGMGLHSVDPGEVGFSLWVDWSKTCPEKFDLADCQKRWRSFHDDGGITHKTIFELAIKHGWRSTGETTGTHDTGPCSPSRPEIHITTEMTEVVNATIQALLTMPHSPHVFQRSRKLCCIAHGSPAPPWLLRPPDAPVIVPAELPALRELAHQAASWLKYESRTKQWKSALPPEWVIATLSARLSWPFPRLAGIVCAPTLRLDGSVIATPGYDPRSELYLDTAGLTFPEIPDYCTLDDAQMAVAELQAVFVDFPFATRAGLSATLAALLSLVARHAIPGCVPLFAVRSTTRGAGKGLLVDAIATIGTGRPAPRWPQVKEEDEERKRLLTIAMSGDACTHLDNVTHPLGSAPLDSALTSMTIADRLLGKNQQHTAPILSVFFASGNNMTFRGDMARRVIPLDLAPEEERPEERDQFSHSPLLNWIHQERPRLVVAALTVLKGYIDAKRPHQGVAPLGSFEGWSDLIRQALIWAGEPDPCEDRRNIEAESDTVYESLAMLLHCWSECYGKEAVTLASAIQDAMTRAVETPNHITPSNEWNALAEALGNFDSRYDGKRLDAKRIGYEIRKIQGRVINNQRFIKDGTHDRAVKWKVQGV